MNDDTKILIDALASFADLVQEKNAEIDQLRLKVKVYEKRIAQADQDNQNRSNPLSPKCSV